MTTLKFPKIAPAIAISSVLALGIAAPAAAETTVNPHSVAVHIEHVGNQRMLSERMAKYFCFARSGIDPMKSVQRLSSAIDTFDTIHVALIEGDDDLEIFAETSPQVKQAWDNVDLMWASTRTYYDKALSGTLVTDQDFDRLNKLTLELDKRVNDMVTQTRAVYATVLGEGGIGEAHLLDLYNRQLMLSQKVAKEVCLVQSGYKPGDEEKELAETIALFENSLAAFQEGFPIGGVPKPPTPAIKDQLAVANEKWQQVRLTASTVASGNAVGLSELAEFVEGTEVFLEEMAEAVHLLAEFEAGTNSGS